MKEKAYKFVREQGRWCREWLEGGKQVGDNVILFLIQK